MDENTIIKQSCRRNRSKLVFSFNMILAATAVFAVLLFLKEEFKQAAKGFQFGLIFNFKGLLGFVFSFPWPRIAIMAVILLVAVGDIILSAYFIKYRPQRKQRVTADEIRGKNNSVVGEIVKMEPLARSIYEVDYKAILRIDGSETDVFCIYRLDKKEPLPIGEKWQLFYDENNGFAVLDKRLGRR